MARIVECVPNFSEGRQKEVIEAIANAIASTEGCSLLDVDPGPSTNRTVYTFVGGPDAVIEGALNAARVAYQLIDMRRHSGEHPRMGALDVCPFIPVRGVSMDDCIGCAREFGERLAAELNVPVYLYNEAATEEHRKTLPQIRAGEYEGLEEKLISPDWIPDFGPAEFIPSWGATATGARKFLIAYNVNLLATKEQAHRIALNVREQGRGKDEPGRLTKVQAIGWYLDEANIAQISMNLTDHEVTPIHQAYEESCKDAQELNVAVVGSQIVGLVPLRAMLQAADYYCEKEGLFLLEEDQKIRLVINRLGLSSLGGFNPKERIIEYMISEESDGPLVSMDLREFVYTVGGRSACPGGGSVSALIASLGAALGTMVGFLSYGNKKFAHLDSSMRKLIPPLYQGMKEILPFVDADAAAFNQYMIATKLPHNTEEDAEIRTAAMRQALMMAIRVPMTVLKAINKLWPTLSELAKVGNLNCKSDMQVGARSLETGAWGAYYNVMTNLKDVEDGELKTKVNTEADEELKLAQAGCAEVLSILDTRNE